MSKVVCPNCKRSITGSPLNSWKFRSYDVERHVCKQCQPKFNFYKGEKGLLIQKALMILSRMEV
jgi:hypothetical protein